MPAAQRETRWWLETGTEVCPACHHAYAYQTEFYCVDCDGPVCGLCVERTLTLEFVCPGCLPARSSEVEESQ